MKAEFCFSSATLLVGSAPSPGRNHSGSESGGRVRSAPGSPGRRAPGRRTPTRSPRPAARVIDASLAQWLSPGCSAVRTRPAILAASSVRPRLLRSPNASGVSASAVKMPFVTVVTSATEPAMSAARVVTSPAALSDSTRSPSRDSWCVHGAVGETVDGGHVGHRAEHHHLPRRRRVHHVGDREVTDLRRGREHRCGVRHVHLAGERPPDHALHRDSGATRQLRGGPDPTGEGARGQPVGDHGHPQLQREGGGRARAGARARRGGEGRAARRRRAR